MNERCGAASDLPPTLTLAPPYHPAYPPASPCPPSPTLYRPPTSPSLPQVLEGLQNSMEGEKRIREQLEKSLDDPPPPDGGEGPEPPDTEMRVVLAGPPQKSLATVANAGVDAGEQGESGGGLSQIAVITIVLCALAFVLTMSLALCIALDPSCGGLGWRERRDRIALRSRPHPAWIRAAVASAGAGEAG